MSSRVTPFNIEDSITDPEALALLRRGERHNLKIPFSNIAPELEKVFSLRFAFPPAPEHWRTESLEISKARMPLFYSGARDPHAVICFPMGFKGHPILLKDEIDILNKEGFSIASSEPLYPGKRRDFMPAYLEGMDRTAFDTDSLFYTLDEPSLPRIIAPHSAGGLTYILQRDQVEPERAARITEQLAGVIHMGLFLDTGGGSSREESRIISAAYRLHAFFHRDTHCGEAWFDKIYMGNNGKITPNSTGYEPPTHGQAIALRKLGRRFIDAFSSSAGNPLHNIPETVIMGQDDKFSCIKTADRYARNANANFILTEGAHNPIKESRRALETFMEEAFRMASAHRQTKRPPQVTKPLVAANSPHAALALESA